MGRRGQLSDWRDRLADYLNMAEGKSFNWSVHSCLTFTTGAVTAMTGSDPWAAEREKLQRLRRRGPVIRYMHRYGGDLEGTADKALALAGLVRKRTASEGDIVLAKIMNTAALGVCLGRICAFIRPHGIARIQPDRIDAVWGW